MACSQVWRSRLPLVVAATVLGALPSRLDATESAPPVSTAAGALIAAPLATPLRSLKVATLDLPRPIGTLPAAPEVAAVTVAVRSADAIAPTAAQPPMPALERSDRAAATAKPSESPEGHAASDPATAPVASQLPPPIPAPRLAATTAAMPQSPLPTGGMAGPEDTGAQLPTVAGQAPANGAIPATLATQEGSAPAPADADTAFQFPAPLVLGEAPAIAAAEPYLQLALDLLLELPGLPADGAGADATSVGSDLDGMEAAAMSALDAAEDTPSAPADAPDAPQGAQAPLPGPVQHDALTVFGRDPNVFPPLTLEYHALADLGVVPQPLTPPSTAPELRPAVAQAEPEGIWPSPAQRLALAGPQLERARKCLAEAIYFESRGEPKRGQIAVAQVVVNRVFSGYYPADVCGTVYQNAHRHLACQFTFACDSVKDVIREPDMWVQAKEIAADMLDGKLWLDSVGRATHYHASWVHPSWVREMTRLDRIGVHTFYRPRRWQG